MAQIHVIRGRHGRPQRRAHHARERHATLATLETNDGQVIGRSGAFTVQGDAHRSAPVIGADRHALALAAAVGVHEPAPASAAIIRPASRL